MHGCYCMSKEFGTSARRKTTTVSSRQQVSSACKIRCCDCLHFPYRVFNISEKGAVFMIILNTFFAMAVLSSFFSVRFKEKHVDLSLILPLIPSCFMVLLFPVVALLSDCYFGRYKILQASIYSLLVAVVLMAVNTLTMSATIEYVTLVPLVLSTACYVACFIPFTMDQLVGASGEQLSFTIYWVLWAIVTCSSTRSVFFCYLPSNHQMEQAFLFGIASLSFVIVFIMMQCCSHLLMTKPQISNPIRLVAQVLNYARKHNFPERRSALTYWEEECPSRIDLGKDKYGGPFTVEEVEDVKTVLKLTLLITFITPVLGSGIVKEMDDSMNHCDSNDLHFWINFLLFLLVISYLPVYQFLVYPFLYNHIPSMLRRIGCGMCLIVLSHAFNSAVEMYVVERIHNVTRTTHTHIVYESRDIPVSSWLILASNLVNRVGLIITASTTVEFSMAQAPCQFRGFVTSVFLELWGVFATLILILLYSSPYQYVAYIVVSVVMLSIFILFVFLSKWYKLRKRDDVIPYYIFAENEFESNNRQEKEYLKNHGWTFD